MIQIGGIGRSLGFADPDAQAGFACAMTRPWYQIFDEPRSKVLREVVHRYLERSP